MIASEKVIVFDIDGTICEFKSPEVEYIDLKPKQDVLDKLLEYRKNGFYIILFTARQMRTHEGNVGRINANTGKVLFEWLEKYNIPYDEIHLGKPWCGKKGFYVDDKAIRPDEFVNLSYDEILNIVNK
ncbi:MAG: HAD-IIIC family phosphatase [Flavobacteriales bacterium]